MIPSLRFFTQRGSTTIGRRIWDSLSRCSQQRRFKFSYDEGTHSCCQLLSFGSIEFQREDTVRMLSSNWLRHVVYIKCDGWSSQIKGKLCFSRCDEFVCTSSLHVGKYEIHKHTEPIQRNTKNTTLDHTSFH